MSQTFDVEDFLNGTVPPKVPSALGEKARGDAGRAARLALTPAQEKDKAAKGKLYLRSETKTYRLGPPQRPEFFHDNGFLGPAGLPPAKVRVPTEADKKMLDVFLSRLSVSEMMCDDRENKKDWPWQNRQRFVRECGGNQPDANLGLKNFLFGKGRSRRVDYERYLRDEDLHRGLAIGTERGIKSIIEDFREHAEAIGLNRQKFSITSKSMYSIGDGKSFDAGPQSSNWRRTLGGHLIWVSGNVTAESAPKGTHIIYKADITFEIEDMFNFNPRGSDGQMNVMDWEGGMLEQSGLAHQFMTYATIYRHVEWDENRPETVKITPGASPPSTTPFKEDFEKEEEFLNEAMKQSGVVVSKEQWESMAKTFYDRHMRLK